ncbi:hypothetical protein PMAYCL1PPCAC_06394, partial [Pristionchus mayeri]
SNPFEYDEANDLQELHEHMNGLSISPQEPPYHFDDSHSTKYCCLNSSDPSEATHHRLATSQSALTWSNVGCELEKAKFHLDRNREQECLDFLMRPWVLSNLGDKRCRRLANRFDIDFIKERLSLIKLLCRIVRREHKGRTTCQYAARATFKFMEYLDNVPSAAPSFVELQNAALLQIMKWAHHNDQISSLGLIEEFLLDDECEKYFTHHMLLHLANRFNFPSLRMACLSSLRTPECIESFQSSPDYLYHLSSIDRMLVEKRAELLKLYREVGQRVPDEVYHFDLHSGCTFEESIHARYDPASYRISENRISAGFGNGEITGLNFDYY